MSSISVGLLSTAHLHANAYAAILSEAEGAEFSVADGSGFSVADGLKLSEVEGIEFVGVTDADENRGRAFADEHNTHFLATDDLLNEVDGAIICSTNADHLDWIDAAAAAGVDVLCEKPLAPSVEQANAAIEACEEADVELGVAMPLRFSQPAQTAKRSLVNGEIGTLQSVAGTNRGKMPGGWFADAQAAGGGAVMDHSVHIVDLVHWLTGELVEEIHAETATRFHDIPVEDVNVLSMELSDGTQFSLDGSWNKPESWEFWGDATVELFGTEGVISVDCFDQTFTHTKRGESANGIESVFWGADPDAGLLADFVDAVAAGQSPETTGREGVNAVAVVEAAYESAERNEPVRVTYEY